MLEPKNSIIIPVYKNEENIPSLLAALSNVLQSIVEVTEVIFVVDGSPDNSYALLKRELPLQSFPSQLVTHSRNFGAFAAIRTGLSVCNAKYSAVMAADLQEPPELMVNFFDSLKKNEADVIFGQRAGRDDGFISGILSNIFWAMYRRFVIKDIPKGGVDIFACNQQVRETLLLIEEPNSSLLAQLFWVGYRRKFIPYNRRKREFGESAWSFRRRFQYMLDSIFSFTDLPILFVLWLGIAGMITSSVVSCIIFVANLKGLIAVSGYTPIMLSILFFSSLILFTQGIIGLYLWRTFENSKKRPLSIIASIHKFDS